MKRFGFWRSISVFAAATLLFTALVTPAIAYADDDFTNAPDIDDGVRTDVGADELVDENNGTITENSGAVNVNNGEIGTNTETGEVITNSGTGEIETNYGAIETNEGTVQTNAEGESSISTNLGTVEENNGSITTNGEDGTIPTNGEYTGTVEENNSYIGQNLETGVVTVNEGMIESNSGTVVTNKDPEDPENSAVTMPGTVCENTGIVENNEGTVNQNSGVVQDNHGTVVNEATGVVEVNHQDGTVNGTGTVNMNLGTGTVADGVTVQKQLWSLGTNISSWVSGNLISTNANNINSFKTRQGNKTELWFDSQSILNIRVLNDVGIKFLLSNADKNKIDVTKNADGTWTIYNLRGNVNLRLEIKQEVEEAEEAEEAEKFEEFNNSTPIDYSSYYGSDITNDVLLGGVRSDGTWDRTIDTKKLHDIIDNIIRETPDITEIDLYFVNGVDSFSLDTLRTIAFYGRFFVLHLIINGKHVQYTINENSKDTSDPNFIYLLRSNESPLTIVSIEFLLNNGFLVQITPDEENKPEKDNGQSGSIAQPGVAGARQSESGDTQHYDEIVEKTGAAVNSESGEGSKSSGKKLINLNKNDLPLAEGPKNDDSIDMLLIMLIAFRDEFYNEPSIEIGIAGDQPTISCDVFKELMSYGKPVTIEFVDNDESYILLIPQMSKNLSYFIANTTISDKSDAFTLYNKLKMYGAQLQHIDNND